ncbi:hypothetical protein [Halomicrobium zhouii]|uniref:hypothetical protein n=1 Tax=Halomicrobium zhouii TaxID=767519 RepID=UPI0015A61407|nr:hypothetical protein [Halomicrobium zhouii]
MATNTVVCPYCGVETNVTTPRGAAITEVLKERSTDDRGSDAGCPNGHQFAVTFSIPQ